MASLQSPGVLQLQVLQYRECQILHAKDSSGCLSSQAMLAGGHCSGLLWQGLPAEWEWSADATHGSLEP